MAFEQAREVQAKYVCLDIVRYSTRPVETQIKILRSLNEIVRECVKNTQVPQDETHRMYIPTGDGMCIAFLDIAERDIHFNVARGILSGIKEHNASAMSQFEVRIGLHAQTDHVIKDINEDTNLAGAGINFAFRVMDLADAGQILASQAVFRDLYETAFIRETGTIKHNIVEDVYRFTGDDTVRKRRSPRVITQQKREKQLKESILAPGKGLSLKSIYRCRNSNVLEDVVTAIENAHHRVWLSGVGLPEIVGNPRVLRALSIKAQTLKVPEKPDQHVRVLLLDAFRSPAIFRALMESNCDEAGEIVKPEDGRRRPRSADPFFKHRLYTNFEAAHRNLIKMPNLAPLVRFYGHAPICWLAIVDHKAYFQPYTFGDASDSPQSGVIGRQMPVFNFQGRASTPYRILEDHFNKLWLTSDIDLFHTGARIIARAKVLWETFERRREGQGKKESKWLEHIYNVLCNEPENPRDRRTYLRRPCISDLLAYVQWEGEYAKYGETETKILDFSLEGTFLKLELDADADLFTSLPKDREPGRDIFVTIRIVPKDGWPRPGHRGSGIDAEAAQHLVNNFLKPTSGKFVYVRKATINHEPFAAFRAQARPGEGNSANA